MNKKHPYEKVRKIQKPQVEIFFFLNPQFKEVSRHYLMLKWAHNIEMILLCTLKQ